MVGVWYDHKSEIDNLWLEVRINMVCVIREGLESYLKGDREVRFLIFGLFK